MYRKKSLISRTSGYLSRIWNRQLLVFFFFLVLSFIFWIFTVGKEVKEQEFDIEVTLTGVPDNVVVTTEPPHKLSIKLKDEVFTLFNYKYRKRKDFKVNINWANVATPTGHVRLLTSNLTKQLMASLKSTTTMMAEYSKNWDISRMAFMDIIIIQIALAEVIAFPTIPLNVTFNEYIDIAKVYSTPNSYKYVNGMLNNITRHLQETGEIHK